MFLFVLLPILLAVTEPFRTSLVHHHCMNSGDVQLCRTNQLFAAEHCCQFCSNPQENSEYHFLNGRCIRQPVGHINKNETFLSYNVSRDAWQDSDGQFTAVVTSVSQCCFFCGVSPNTYEPVCQNDNPNCSPVFCRQNSAYDDADGGGMRCIICTAVVKELKIDQLSLASICALHGMCKGVKLIGAPRSRRSILLAGDGKVMPAGSLADLAEFNYEQLVAQYLGDDTTDGVEKTLKFLARYGLIANTVVCRECQDYQGSLVKRAEASEGLIWRCNHCRTASGSEVSSRMSIRIGSFFDNVHLSIKQTLRLAYWWAKHPTSNLDTIMRETGVASQTTVIDFYNFFRDLCQSWAERAQAQDGLGGRGRVVEIDESKFFRAKYNRGRMLRRQYDWVFGMLERGSNRVRFFPVERRDAATLLPLIAENILPGTMIVSDGWAAYGGISNMQQQYDHRWVNHRVHFVDPLDRQVLTQGIEATWGELKTSLRHLRGSNEELLPTYLYQYMFRRFHQNTKIYQHILEEMRLTYPV